MQVFYNGSIQCGFLEVKLVYIFCINRSIINMHTYFENRSASHTYIYQIISIISDFLYFFFILNHLKDIQDNYSQI